MNPMTLSDAGIALIESVESVRLTWYTDKAGYRTIGVGHKLTPAELQTGTIALGETTVDWTNGLTRDEVDQLLRQDSSAVVNGLNGEIASSTVTLTQGQFDALVSFTFNVGLGAELRSTLLKDILAGDLEAVPDQMRLWNKMHDPATGLLIVSSDLVERREAEVARWNAPDDGATS